MSSRVSSFVRGRLAVAAALAAARPRRAGSGGGGALGCTCSVSGALELAVSTGIAPVFTALKQLSEIDHAARSRAFR